MLDTGWLDSLNEGIILISQERVTYLNEAACRYLGVDRHLALGAPLIAVLRDHRLERVYHDGNEAELQTRGRMLHAKPVPGGLLLRDLTRLRKTEENARELLAVLSHELRTPVATIRATLEALQLDMPEPQRQRFLERATSEAERLTRLLEDLTVDVKPPQLRRLSLQEISARAANLVQGTLRKHGITLQVDVQPLTVWADNDKLLQVLINLLENAAIHGPDHKIVHLLGYPDPNDAARARVCVRDQGEPLPKELIERLFEPHTRGNSVKARGTGLGLYIVRSIAQRWDGHAWGRPLEQGNEFGFSVPLR